MIPFRKFVNIQKISECSSYTPLMLILLPAFENTSDIFLNFVVDYQSEHPPYRIYWALLYGSVLTCHLQHEKLWAYYNPKNTKAQTYILIHAHVTITDVAMDTGDHVTFTWILYVYYECVHINIFVYTFRYGYPNKLNWLPWKHKI